MSTTIIIHNKDGTVRKINDDNIKVIHHSPLTVHEHRIYRSTKTSINDWFTRSLVLE